ncbi:hypothetical protein ZOD2009_06559 [Haladaptatus paucihalophilus DX253]|uniref:Protein-glutamine gamma-glutamyltransferase-like C-terminal domain-containing protein n=1 Tax=Haladaptatus paucihalophilus DX253 TaxID=797209 RepID=E7QR89_HALPU|nr:DUF4129 domain-containing protein [Haladaptatus paucihalophilus]EFW92997.1 hypothetical protein ZOD2009_06559 [Haladaptatus paucihalophilus DX253]SHL17206.1 protein of unknown function [Haladaptatus paucihalophilus DX253]
MERNRLRAALIALCVLAVIFGASLFPATGFGSYPAGPGGGNRADTPGAPSAGSRSTVSAGNPSDPGTVATTTAQTTTNSESSGGSADSETATTTTTAASASQSTSNGTPLLQILGKAVGILVLVGGAFLAVGFRRGTLALDGDGAIPLTVRGIPVGELVGKIPARTMGLVVGFSASIPRLADDAIGLLGEVGRGLAASTVGLGSALGRTIAVMGRGFSGTLLAIGSVGSGLFSIPKTLSRPTLSGRSGGKSESRTATNEGTAPAEPEERGPPSIEEAWESMTEHLPVRRRRTTTPGEYAREAIQRGYPADAVRQLTAAFREVRYGSLPPTANRTKLARAALDKIDRFREGDE